MRRSGMSLDFMRGRERDMYQMVFLWDPCMIDGVDFLHARYTSLIHRFLFSCRFLVGLPILERTPQRIRRHNDTPVANCATEREGHVV